MARQQAQIMPHNTFNNSVRIASTPHRLRVHHTQKRAQQHPLLPWPSRPLESPQLSSSTTYDSDDRRSNHSSSPELSSGTRTWTGRPCALHCTSTMSYCIGRSTAAGSPASLLATIRWHWMLHRLPQEAAGKGVKGGPGGNASVIRVDSRLRAPGCAVTYSCGEIETVM